MSTARAPHLKSSYETSDSNSRGFDPYTISSRAGWRPNPRRSSRPVLTVPLLLRTSHQEEPEGASYEKRERNLWGVGTPEVFFWFQHSRPFKYLSLLRHMNPGGKLTSSPAYPVRGQCVEFGGGGGTSPFFLLRNQRGTAQVRSAG